MMSVRIEQVDVGMVRRVRHGCHVALKNEPGRTDVIGVDRSTSFTARVAITKKFHMRRGAVRCECGDIDLRCVYAVQALLLDTVVVRVSRDIEPQR